MRVLLFKCLIALLVLASTEAPAWAQDDPVTFHCELRTPASDTIGLKITALSVNDQRLLLIGSRDGASWPGDHETTAVGVFEKANETEFQYSFGNQRIRIERAGQQKNMTIWSHGSGELRLPLAFGFCGNSEIANTENLAPIGTKVFDTGRWKDGCFATQYTGNKSHQFSFRYKHKNSDKGHIVTSFGSGDQSALNSVSVPAEVLHDNVRARHPSVSMKVNRFAPAASEAGPKGMDVSYIDRDEKKISTIVRFNTLTGADGPAYAICGAVSPTHENPK